MYYNSHTNILRSLFRIFYEYFNKKAGRDTKSTCEMNICTCS